MSEKAREELLARIEEQDRVIDALLDRCERLAKHTLALQALLAEKKPTPEALAGNWPLVE